MSRPSTRSKRGFRTKGAFGKQDDSIEHKVKIVKFIQTKKIEEVVVITKETKWQLLWKKLLSYFRRIKMRWFKCIMLVCLLSIITGCAGLGLDKKTTVVPDEVWIQGNLDPQTERVDKFTGGIKWKLE